MKPRQSNVRKIHITIRISEALEKYFYVWEYLYIFEFRAGCQLCKF